MFSQFVFEQPFRISEIRALSDGSVSLKHDSDPDFYYILYRGDHPSAAGNPADMALGSVTLGEFLDAPPQTRRIFYRVLKLPMDDPLDTDGDGADDVFELTFSSLMSPFNASDGSADPDLDGLTNREEAKGGTDPGTFNSIELTSPEPGTTLDSPANFALDATTDNTIVRVEFFEGLNLLSEDDSAPFTASWNNVAPGDYILTAVGYDTVDKGVVSKAVPVSVNIAEPQLAVSSTATRDASVQLTGLTVPDGTITVAGGLQTVVGQAAGDGSVDMSVPLHENKVNRLFVTVADSGGRTTSPLPFEVLHDSVPPTLFIDFPPSEVEQFVDSVVVAGRVGDMLSGFMGLDVTVNGQPANVVVGIGQNGTYERGSVPLELGINKITVVATDALGNSTTKNHRLNRVIPSGSILTSISGDGQSGVVRNKLTDPVVIQVLTEGLDPFPNKLVTFDVSRSDGRLSSTPDPEVVGENIFQAFTDANGFASAFWTLGNDSGCGNNRITVTSGGISGTVFFCASADAEPASQINIGSGNNLKAEVGSLSPGPMVAWVNDSCNGVAGVDVTFTVIEGSGLVNGQNSVTIPTTITGHATVEFRLGSTPGNNRVRADFPGNPNDPATFVIQGVARDLEMPTSYTGIVLNNARLPIQGALCTLEVEGQEVGEAISGSDGRFNMIDVPAGPAHLNVDGYPATSVGGMPIDVGSYPALAYETLIIPNAENSLPVPVLLPPLNPANAREYDGTQDVELTVEEIAGLKMIVKAGSMTLKDGTKPSPETPATLTLNQVHHDDVPMPMPDGAAPPFAWTLQPAGATFDPPIDIEYPNMSSLPAGAIAYFLSFNHDTESFEIVATGHVLDDGSKIVTDPGVGLTVAGWGCNCPPYSIVGICISLIDLIITDPTKEPDGPPNCVDECFDNGRIRIGTSVRSSFIRCVGDTVVFRSPTATDTGGEKKRICTFPGGRVEEEIIPIPPGGVAISWQVYRNGGLFGEGMGETASVVLGSGGSYQCIFTATPEREDCPPLSVRLPAQTAFAVEVVSVSGGTIVSTTRTPGPMDTIKVCQGGAGETITLTAQSSLGIWPAGQPVWSGANGDGSTATFPIDTVSSSALGDIISVRCNSSEKAIRVLVVGVESVSAEGIVSTTEFPGENETIRVCQGNPGDTITLTAKPMPGTMWPASEPQWINASGSGSNATFPIDTLSTSPLGDLITVRCGQSEKSIAIVVVGVKSLTSEGVISTTDNPGKPETVKVCKGDPADTITITAMPDPGTTWPSGEPMWINANGAGSTATFLIDTLSADANGTVVTAVCGASRKSIRIVVYEIESVVWMAKDAPLDLNRNAGGGLRIFAEKPVSTADVQDEAIALATIRPKVEDADVYFKMYDVDDPSSNRAPGAMPAGTDDETNPSDNRGAFTQVAFGPFKTNAQGQAQVEATLSRQPGDNFKVVADCDPASDYFGGAAKQNDAASARVLDSTGGFVPGTNITDLLTVWRTLHIEVDSMVVFDPAINKVNGNIVEFSASSQGTAVSLLDTDVDPYDGSNHPGRFDMGTLKIGNPPEKTITPIIGEFTNGIHLSAMDISILPLSFSAIDEDNFDNGTMSGTVTEITRSGNDYVYTLNITANNENPIDWPDFVGGNISVAGGAGQEILVVNSGTTQVIANGLNLPFELMDDDTATRVQDKFFPDMPHAAFFWSQ